jgi:hypothetical protein
MRNLAEQPPNIPVLDRQEEIGYTGRYEKRVG